MIFTFVYAGWEGVAHDSMVLTEVMAAPSNNFPFPPPSKYYLCDVAYTNTRVFMAPYRNVRYWL
ncbi:DDE_4 domain-containing protein [Cephalotus follicularis]|uniref:DDE_4 domain-containing protein n=1 Tax=Cephalotus follicularis TaxID=3775 RepID=A0A1Q3CTV4_CEPFO|nr:DDE_4 domain-containing protein [Cephalotus follicularis]